MISQVLVLVCFSGLWSDAYSQQAAEPEIFIEIVSGDQVSNNVKKRITQPLVVEVHDRNNRPVAGALVTFAMPTNGASATFSNGTKLINLTTDKAGRVAVNGMKANRTAGSYRVNITATHNGRTATATVAQTNLAVAAGAGLGTGALVAIIAGSAAAIVGTVVAVTQGGGDKNAKISIGTPKLP